MKPLIVASALHDGVFFCDFVCQSIIKLLSNKKITKEFLTGLVIEL
jgi:hypothetical protein